MALLNLVNSPNTFIKSGWIVSRFLTNYGHKDDGFDARDISITKSPLMGAELLTNPSVKKYFKEISNQYTLSSCVGNSTADMTEALIAKRKKLMPSQVENLSRLFVYYCARNNETPPSADKDDGTRIRLAMDAISRYGLPSETLWTYDITKVNVRPPASIFKAALANRIYGYYKIDGSGEERWGQIKQALSAGSGVVFGMKISNNFKQPQWDQIIATPTTSIIGSHAIVIVEMDESAGDEKVLIRNSWDTSWGNNGYAYVSKEYILSSLCGDFWAANI